MKTILITGASSGIGLACAHKLHTDHRLILCSRNRIQIFWTKRIMFGSDQPLNLIRAKSYLNPTKGQRLITEYKYHWVDNTEHAEFKHLANDLVHTHWPSVFALKSVIEEFPTDTQNEIKEMVFYRNAHGFYNFK